MAVLGNADIFSIKVDSRLKTILIHTGVAPKIDYSSVFIQKFICSPKCRFRECSWRGIGKMPDQPKTPLKVGQSGCNFHRKLNLYQRMILYRAGLLEGNFRNFNFRGVGGPMSYQHFLIQPSEAVFSLSWITYDTHDTTGIPDVILKPMQSDLVSGK